jgi:raffinose/stachyose/melibiose transport system substrate-binding protein
VESNRLSRRNFLGLAALSVPVVAGVAACSSSGPSKPGAGGGSGTAAATGGGGGGGTATGTASYWFLSGAPQQGIREDSVKAFNKANPKGQIKYTEFQNDAYKTKIKTAIGAGQAPTIIWGWGGGGLRSYVQANQVDDLTSWFAQNADVKSRLFPGAFGAATVDGKIYAMPSEAVQPIILYYNKKVLDKVGVAPPKSWADIMDMVPKINAKGIAPFSLAGASRWTNMMWLEMLFDRIGGPAIFDAVYNGKKDAWSNPDAIKALTDVQELVKANGFIKGFQSIVADQNADQAVFYTGKAAMMLHGSWTYGNMKSSGGDFVTGGHLGWMNFPPVDGGKGDPSNQYGNPGQYLSISSKASEAQKQIALNYFKTGVLADAEVAQWIKTGSVPIVKTAASQLSSAGADAPFLQFVYDVSSKAKTFSQSWDQALSPAAAEVLLDNISKLFGLSISPQQFANNLNAEIGK